MNKQPLISVIVPVYNVEKYLNRCVTSIINQTYRNLEIILVDDGSTDSSGRLCDEYRSCDQRVIVIHISNSGLSVARNVGMKVAKGEFIGFVDSDDWISFDMYEYLYILLVKYNGDIASIRSVYTRGEEVKDIREGNLHFFVGKEILEKFLYDGMKTGSYSTCKNLYRTELLKGCYFPEGRINEDILFNYEVFSKARKTVKSSKICYYYFQRTGSITTGGLKKRDYDLLYICKEMEKLVTSDTSQRVRYLVKVKTARSYFSLLAKIAFYGIHDKDIDRKSAVNELTSQLRANLGLLLKSPMPLSRKLMAVLLGIHINCLEYPLKIYKKIRHL